MTTELERLFWEPALTVAGRGQPWAWKLPANPFWYVPLAEYFESEGIDVERYINYNVARHCFDMRVFSSVDGDYAVPRKMFTLLESSAVLNWYWDMTWTWIDKVYVNGMRYTIFPLLSDEPLRRHLPFDYYEKKAMCNDMAFNHGDYDFQSRYIGELSAMYEEYMRQFRVGSDSQDLFSL